MSMELGVRDSSPGSRLVPGEDEDYSGSWMHNTITKRLLIQVQDEIASINMGLISGDLDQKAYSHACGRIAGLRVIEDFITHLRS